MKWIGQLIYDQIARFRNEIYLEGISTSTETDMLVVDSNNKVSKRAIDAITVDVSDFMTNGSDNRVLTATGTDAMNAEANLTFDGSTLTLAGDITATGDTFTFQSSNADDPQFVIKNTTADNQGARLQFYKDRGAAMVDNDRIGEIDFFGEDASQNSQQYGKIQVQTVETAHGTETSKMDFKVAQYDGTVSTGLLLTGQDADDEIDVNIGKGVGSTTVIEGGLRPVGQIYMTHHNFNDDIDTTKIYLGLADADSEQSATTNIDMPLVFPTASKLLKVILRANSDLSGKTLTWRLETQATGVTLSTGPTIVGTQSGAGCTNSSLTTYDFTSSLDSGDNIIDAGDMVYLSIQSNATTSATKFYVTCIWEVNFGSI